MNQYRMDGTNFLGIESKNDAEEHEDVKKMKTLEAKLNKHFDMNWPKKDENFYRSDIWLGIY